MKQEVSWFEPLQWNPQRPVAPDSVPGILQKTSSQETGRMFHVKQTRLPSP